jgi:hypothetical protein
MVFFTIVGRETSKVGWVGKERAVARSVSVGTSEEQGMERRSPLFYMRSEAASCMVVHPGLRRESPAKIRHQTDAKRLKGGQFSRQFFPRADNWAPGGHRPPPSRMDRSRNGYKTGVIH